MIRLLLVESQPAIRLGLRMRLKLEPDMSVIGEAADGLAALSRAAVLRPDVILLDMESAGIDGVRLVAAMRSASPESALVILTLRDDAITRRRALAAGATVFVSKHEVGDRLPQAIRQAASVKIPSTSALPAGRVSPNLPTPGFNDGSV